MIMPLTKWTKDLGVLLGLLVEDIASVLVQEVREHRLHGLRDLRRAQALGLEVPDDLGLLIVVDRHEVGDIVGLGLRCDLDFGGLNSDLLDFVGLCHGSAP